MESNKQTIGKGGFLYDVFISYRRAKGRDIARQLQLGLEKLGLRVFFDLEEIRDGKFNEALYKSIDYSRFVIFLFTEGALDNCINEGDWIRRELEHAFTKNLPVIPVAPSGHEIFYPRGLPESLKALELIQVSRLDLEGLFKESLEKIFVDRLGGQMVRHASVAEVMPEIPELGRPVDDLSLTRLKGDDAVHFRRVVEFMRALRYRSALAEVRQIQDQGDPLVVYYLKRLVYELEGGVSDETFDRACRAAMALGCTDAMTTFAAKYLERIGSAITNVPAADCFDWLKKAIAGGNAYAYSILGEAYGSGQGVPKNSEVARNFYQRSIDAGCIGGRLRLVMHDLENDAEKNVAEASSLARPVLRYLEDLEKTQEELSCREYAHLAYWFWFGVVVESDLDRAIGYAEKVIASPGKGIIEGDAEKAICYLLVGLRHMGEERSFQLYQEAVQSGYVFGGLCENELAKCYLNGVGVEADEERAMGYFRDSANHGSAPAKCQLARYYLAEGPHQDVERGQRLLLAAAEAGDGDAQLELGMGYGLGTNHFEIDQAKAVEWYTKAADEENTLAMYALGLVYREGRESIAADPAKAIEWLKKGVAGDDVLCMAVLADMYLNGEGVAEDVVEAIRLLTLSAERGNEEAERMLGDHYSLGHFGRVDAKKAVEWWLKAAEHGDATGMENVGLAYLGGNGVPEDKKLAQDWLEKAAANGNASAECSLGTRFAQGEFGEVDMPKAVEWWRKSAEHGDGVAMNNLGLTYRDGIEGVEVDFQESVKWFAMGDEAGHQGSTYNLGLAYLLGQGVAQNNKEAERLWIRAAEAGSADAQCALGLRYQGGDFGEPDLEKALKWTQRAVDQGDDAAMRNLSLMYQDGVGVVPDPKKAMDLMRQSADAGNVYAMTDLGVAYVRGDIVNIDQEKGRSLLLRAVELGHVPAEGTLGNLYSDGAFGEGQAEQALAWWRKAADHGDALAMERIGLAYLVGTGVPEDKKLAQDWLEKAADNGNSSAECSLGTRFAQGQFGEIDMVKAVEWWRRSAAHDYAIAMCNLGQTYRDGAKGIAVNLNEAVKWFMRGADAGDPSSMVELGMAYLGGNGVREDRAEAERLFIRAAETGDAAAQNALGLRYENGDLGEADSEKAVLWLRKAAEQGNDAALRNLSINYREGRGVEKDVVMATNLLLRSAEAGNMYAMYDIGEAYIEGTGVVVDEDRGRDWLLKAAAAGNVGAECLLGTHYAKGDFDAGENFPEALNWWEKAANHGDATASYNLGYVHSVQSVSNGQVAPDPDTARTWFLKAVEFGHEGALYDLGMDCLGLMGCDDLQFDAWQESVLGHYEDGNVLRRRLKKANSFFQQPINRNTGDDDLAGRCLLMQARIARLQGDAEMAKSLYLAARGRNNALADKEMKSLSASPVDNAVDVSVRVFRRTKNWLESMFRPSRQGGE